MKRCPMCQWKPQNESGFCSDCEPTRAEDERYLDLQDLKERVPHMSPSERDELRAALDTLGARYA